MSEVKITPELEQAVDEATIKAFKGVLKDSEAQDFIASLRSATVPSPIDAVANLHFAIVKGTLTIDTVDGKHHFKADLYGLGLADIKDCKGFMYTAYTTWDAFFRNVTSCWAQGITSGVGFLQVNFFNKDAVPVGQFHGVATGVGAFEVGGPGKWS